MKKLIYLGLCLLILFGCRKDIDEQIKEKDIFQPEVTYFPVVNPVTASVLGVVMNEAGNTIEGATVSLGVFTKLTDEKGRFYFSKIEMNKSGTYVKVEKNGYFDGSSRFFPQEASENYVTIKLMAETEAGTFNSSSGGLIVGDGGFEISFPSNSIRLANGSDLYDGEVSVFARWINPEEEALGDIMPGNLQGIDEREEEVALVTYGMLAVELKTPFGQALQLADNQSATLTFPLSPDMLSNAPSTIPLWHFNETVGIWVEEGSAVLDGNSYVGEVTHFSFWNCDAPFPLIELSGRLVTSDGNPVANALVTIDVNNLAGYGYTNGDGFFNGKVPANQDLLISFQIQINECLVDVTQEIEGNYSVNTELGEILVLEAIEPEMVNISIQLSGCSNDPVSGLLEVNNGSSFRTYYYDDVNEIQLAMLNCEMGEELTIKFIDIEELSESIEATFPISNNVVTVNNFDVCVNSVGEFIKFFIDGVQSINVTPSIFISNDTFSLSGGTIDFSELTFWLSQIVEVGENNIDFVDYIYINGQSNFGRVHYSCRLEGCGIENFNITDLGDFNEKVIGSISGIGEFFDIDTIARELPYLIEFEVIRD